jgi:hypothetical protein
MSKNLMNIVKNIVGENKKGWDSKIKYALWEDHTTTKTSMEKTINLQIPVLQFAQQFTTDKEALQGRIDQLIELDESIGDMILIKWKGIKTRLRECLIIKQDKGTLKMVTLYLCGTRGKRIQVCIRSLIVYGLALTRLRRSLELIPFI